MPTLSPTSSDADAPQPRGGVGFAALDAALRAAVETVAATDPTPADPLRGLYISDDAALQAARGLDGATFDERLGDIAAVLGLDGLDTAILGLCLAPEADPSYGRLIAYLLDDVTRRRPSPRLLARLLSGPECSEPVVLARLGARAPLRATGALTLAAPEAALPAAERMLSPDPLLTSVALGTDLDATDPPAGISDVARRAVGPWPAALLSALRELAESAGAGDGPLLGVAGPDAEQALAAAVGSGLVLVRPASAADAELLAQARLRALLHGTLPAVGAVGAVDGDELGELADMLARLGVPRILVGDEIVDAARNAGVPVHTIAVPPLTAQERGAAWAAQLPSEADGAGVAGRFPLSRTQIADAAVLAHAHARQDGLDVPLAHHLIGAGQALVGTVMGGLARRLQAPRGWDDLVLPEAEVATLRSIAAYLRHRETVLDEWGFGSLSNGPGLTVMFSGRSGTGKTLAAQIIANDLGLEAYHVDVSAIVSKYIGETEKNLERLFRAAVDVGALMVFDEADALFGKRSAVTDARDRYANLEVSYLLQRIESHPGASILTTNMRQNIDQAFLRRMDFIVDFPLPGERERLAIWRRHLPPAAPTAGELDFASLAREHELPGGSIRNCLRAAAFAAADNGGAIEMSHLRDAVRLELRKLGRLSAAPG
ncbi:MAG: hypothetical protein QOJ85_2344 [Solirubrobacteraceae bacterium]|nr:hypothetical protein [Solirubrobacteraceae bacterium]